MALWCFFYAYKIIILICGRRGCIFVGLGLFIYLFTSRIFGANLIFYGKVKWQCRQDGYW